MNEPTNDRKIDILFKAVVAGFIVAVIVAAAFAALAYRSTDAAIVQLERRSAVVTYLREDNVWDNCNDDKNRTFFIAVSDVIKASQAGDEKALAAAAVRLAEARTELNNIASSAVCGPPPLPPQDD